MAQKILIVEDTRVLAEAIADTLRMEGFQVTIALNGVSALACLERFVPDLIISDWLMPLMDGLEFTRQVRLHPVHARTPVILISARDTAGLSGGGGDAGADVYLNKPFDNEDLLRAIFTLLK